MKLASSSPAVFIATWRANGCVVVWFNARIEVLSRLVAANNAGEATILSLLNGVVIPLAASTCIWAMVRAAFGEPADELDS